MERTAFIGSGEAARAVAEDGGWRLRARCFDPKLPDMVAGSDVERAAAAAGVACCLPPPSAVSGSDVVLGA